MEDEELFLKDWEIAKDRIKHFDDVAVRLRIQGLPIATAIQAAGWISFPYTKSIIISPLGCTTTSLTLLFGSLYLLPLLALDIFHFKLMLIAVDHARSIENERFHGKIQITTKLTSTIMTISHTVVAVILYLLVILFGIISAMITWRVT